jgi:hypothetical protein
MAYLGERLLQCNAVPFNWSQSRLIIVSGSGITLCGHTIVSAGAFYFHIDGLNDYPWYMAEVGYRRYLKENAKRELYRRQVLLKNPMGAQKKIRRVEYQAVEMDGYSPQLRFLRRRDFRCWRGRRINTE